MSKKKKTQEFDYCKTCGVADTNACDNCSEKVIEDGVMYTVDIPTNYISKEDFEEAFERSTNNNYVED